LESSVILFTEAEPRFNFIRVASQIIGQETQFLHSQAAWSFMMGRLRLYEAEEIMQQFVSSAAKFRVVQQVIS
jgi:hypothetical protein